MIIFYPPPAPFCQPVVIADMTDSSDQWSTAELTAQAYLNIPQGIFFILPPLVYSCKYEYEVQHNGSPLGQGVKMTLNASIKMPPSDLIAQVSISYVSEIFDPAAALVKAANPRLNVMYAVVVEKTGLVSSVVRPFVAYSSTLHPDAFGASATLFIRGAHMEDTLIRSTAASFGLQLNALLPLGSQLQAIVAPMGYIVDTSAAPAALLPPVSGILSQPTTLHKFLDKVCLQNKLLYNINGFLITFYNQTTQPLAGADMFLKTEFSFLGYAGALMWGVGVENYANVKFKTPIYDVTLFDTVTIYDDSTSGLFSGLKRNLLSGLLTPASYDMIVLKYAIIRNDSELCVEVTATNNWLFSQCRVDGIFEPKIYGSVSG